MYDCLMRLKILILDNNQFEANVLQEIINKYGHNCIICNSSENAIALILQQYEAEKPFDVVFIEYYLEDDSGASISKKLYAIDPTLTINIMTSDNSLSTKVKIAKTAKFSGFISKTSGAAEIQHHLGIAMSNKKEKLSGDYATYSHRKSGKGKKAIKSKRKKQQRGS